MSEIGVRQLKIHASEIVRKVKEKRMRYVITRRGRPVAAIVPFDDAQPGARLEDAAAWDELVALGQQIGQNWQSAQSSTEILTDMRR